MTSEADALANMMAADSKRVDQLVDDVGIVKGRMESVHAGVNELRAALTVLVKHEVLMGQNSQAAIDLRGEVAAINARVHVVEKEIPSLKETREWIVRGMLAILGVLGLAVVALVMK